MILTGPQLNVVGAGTDEYSGLLEPDQIYTLQVSLSTQDFFQPNVYQSFDVGLNVPEILPVPEPSSSMVLGLGGAAAGLIVLWRKRPALKKTAQ